MPRSSVATRSLARGRRTMSPGEPHLAAAAYACPSRSTQCLTLFLFLSLSLPLSLPLSLSFCLALKQVNRRVLPRLHFSSHPEPVLPLALPVPLRSQMSIVYQIFPSWMHLRKEPSPPFHSEIDECGCTRLCMCSASQSYLTKFVLCCGETSGTADHSQELRGGTWEINETPGKEIMSGSPHIMPSNFTSSSPSELSSASTAQGKAPHSLCSHTSTPPSSPPPLLSCLCSDVQLNIAGEPRETSGGAGVSARLSSCLFWFPLLQQIVAIALCSEAELSHWR
jgi:hypothetical protein